MLKNVYIVGSIVALSLVVNGCTSSDKKVSSGTGSNSSWTRGVYQPSSNFEQRCLNPRTGNDFDDIQGTAMDEKMWIRSMSNELYLWNDQLSDVDPSPFAVLEYFGRQKISGDRFHFTIPTDEYLNSSQSGVYFGYGISWVTIDEDEHSFGVGEKEASANLPSELKRGDEMLGADGVYIDDAFDETLSEAEQNELIDTLNSAILPSKVGDNHVFYFKDRDTGNEKTITLTAANVKHSPVPISKEVSTPTGKVGYLQFNDHNAASEDALISAISNLKTAGVNDLILDLRYNGGGYIYIASMLSYMIAGPGHTNGKTFTDLRFNDDVGDRDPFTGEQLEPIPFYDDDSDGVSIPTLNLDRVFILTSSGTCSASELIMNGLSGVGVDIIQLGNTTCGKPYSFYPLENCGTMYFTVMSENVNALGFSGYSGGFSANETNFSAPDVFQGCVINDDFSHDLGDTDEGMLAAALEFRAQGRCPTAVASLKPLANKKPSSRLYPFLVDAPKSMSIIDARKRTK